MNYVVVIVVALLGVIAGFIIGYKVVMKKVAGMLDGSMNAHQWLIAVEGRMKEVSDYHYDVRRAVERLPILSPAKRKTVLRTVSGLFNERVDELTRVLVIAKENAGVDDAV